MILASWLNVVKSYASVLSILYQTSTHWHFCVWISWSPDTDHLTVQESGDFMLDQIRTSNQPKYLMLFLELAVSSTMKCFIMFLLEISFAVLYLLRSIKLVPEEADSQVINEKMWFLQLDEAVAYRAVFVIVFQDGWADGRVETLLEPAK